MTALLPPQPEWEAAPDATLGAFRARRLVQVTTYEAEIRSGAGA